MSFEAKSPFKEKIKTEKALLHMHVGRVKCSWMTKKVLGVFILF